MAKTKTDKSLWLSLPVTLKCHNLRGTEPKTPTLVDEFAEKRSREFIRKFLDMKKKGERGLKQLEDVAEMMGTNVATLEQMADSLIKDWPKSPEQVSDAMAVGFLGDSERNGQFYLRAGSIRAHLKDCADSLRSFVEQKYDLKQFGPKLRKATYIAGHGCRDKVYVEKIVDGHETPVCQADESPSHTLRVMTARGERSCLKVVDQVNDCQLRFYILLLNDGVITRDHLYDVFEYGKVHGTNQDRSLQYGQYEFELGEESEV